MKLVLSNLGKLHDETVIQFDGVTVLAGDNGSGKSTISKALYCMFHGFYDIEDKIYQDREREIANIILNSRMFQNSSRRVRSLSGVFIDRLIDDYGEENNIQVIIDRINQLKIQLIDGLTIEELARRIEQVLLIPDKQICERLIERILQNKYDGNVTNVNYPEEDCSIRLIVKGKELSVCISPDGSVLYQLGIDLLRDVIYIDDSFGNENLFGRAGWYSSGYRWSRAGLRIDVNMEEDALTATAELINEKKAAKIFSLMAEAGIGDMRKDENGRWFYAAENLRKPIGIENISSGTKTFLTLKYLIMNDQIDKKGVLILDEPEVHLHPKWQELYAEIIILLQKTYDLTLLVSTHSADFVSFLEYSARKHGSSKICQYYLMKNVDDGKYAIAENVTESIDKIYKELSMPYIRVTEKLAEGDVCED